MDTILIVLVKLGGTAKYLVPFIGMEVFIFKERLKEAGNYGVHKRTIKQVQLKRQLWISMSLMTSIQPLIIIQWF